MRLPTGSPARLGCVVATDTRPLRARVIVSIGLGLTTAFMAGPAQQPVRPLLQYLMVGARRIAFESPEGAVARFRYVDQALGRARRPGAARDGQPMSACYRPVADSAAG